MEGHHSEMVLKKAFMYNLTSLTSYVITEFVIRTITELTELCISVHITV